MVTILLYTAHNLNSSSFFDEGIHIRQNDCLSSVDEYSHGVKGQIFLKTVLLL